MAARVTTETVRASATADSFRDGELLVAAGAVGNFEPGYGGFNADVVDGSTTWEVWVGVVDLALVGECDCAAAEPSSLCPHAVAVAMTAVNDGAQWPSSSGSDRDAAGEDPAHGRFLVLAQSLSGTDLAALVARHAVRDRLVATDLEVTVGLLGAPTADDLAPLRALVDAARAIPDGRREYDLHEVVAAVRTALTELQVQALRPPSVALLDAVEYTVERWDHLAGVLHQDWRTYEDEIAEIGAALAAVHLDLCEQLRPDGVAALHVQPSPGGSSARRSWGS